MENVRQKMNPYAVQYLIDRCSNLDKAFQVSPNCYTKAYWHKIIASRRSGCTAIRLGNAPDDQSLSST